MQKISDLSIKAEKAAQTLYGILSSRGLRLATAESCTGGLIGKTLTDVPGISEVYDGGVISYANSVKMRVLSVGEATLARYGAVSEQTACEMAVGARMLVGADIAVSVTGIAGPGGGTAEKPVGLVYIGVSTENGVYAVKNLFDGTREQVRLQTCIRALELAAEELNS